MSFHDETHRSRSEFEFDSLRRAPSDTDDDNESQSSMDFPRVENTPRARRLSLSPPIPVVHQPLTKVTHDLFEALSAMSLSPTTTDLLFTEEMYIIRDILRHVNPVLMDMVGQHTDFLRSHMMISRDLIHTTPHTPEMYAKGFQVKHIWWRTSWGTRLVIPHSLSVHTNERRSTRYDDMGFNLIFTMHTHTTMMCQIDIARELDRARFGMQFDPPLVTFRAGACVKMVIVNLDKKSWHLINIQKFFIFNEHDVLWQETKQHMVLNSFFRGARLLFSDDELRWDGFSPVMTYMRNSAQLLNLLVLETLSFTRTQHVIDTARRADGSLCYVTNLLRAPVLEKVRDIHATSSLKIHPEF
jgi:hypothetical protein